MKKMKNTHPRERKGEKAVIGSNPGGDQKCIFFLFQK